MPNFIVGLSFKDKKFETAENLEWLKETEKKLNRFLAKKAGFGETNKYDIFRYLCHKHPLKRVKVETMASCFRTTKPHILELLDELKADGCTIEEGKEGWIRYKKLSKKAFMKAGLCK